jgi:phenylacetate-CoA ligase
MNKKLVTLYDHSPIFFQNMFCSLYGFQLYRERYSGKWGQYFNWIDKTQYLSSDELHDIQINSLRNIIYHAVEYVPYYKEKIRIKSNEVNEINSMDVLNNIGIVDKETLRNSTDSFLSEKYDKNKLIKINTSGTTGTPLTIYLSSEARKLNYAFFARSKKWAGISGFERSITLAGRTIVPVSQKKPPYWRKNIVFNNELFSSYHISEDNLGYYVDQIRRIRPVFIDSYPSSISIIAEYMLKKNVTDIAVKAIITSAETLLDHQRDIIEKAFGCKVYDQYGSAEQVIFACQCEHGSYHVNPEYGYLEVLDKNNNKVPNGQLGEFVCTGFTNQAMSLIRYKIGDKGILSDKQCDCGRKFQVLEKIFGRNDDILITPDGKYVGRLDPIFKGMGSTIRETQIVQEQKDLIYIKIVRGENYLEQHGQFIIDELVKRMGHEIHFKIQYVDRIPRTNAGKFRAVICNI